MMQCSLQLGRLVAAVLALLTVGLSTGRAAEDVASSKVSIGIVSSVFRDTAPSLITVITPPLRALMEAQMGMKGELLIGGDALTVGKALKEKRLHLAVLHSWELGWARQVCPELKPLVICVAQKEGLRANLVVHKDSSITTVADLKGIKLSMPAVCRGHLHLYLERRCTLPDTDPGKFFSAIRRAVNAEDALDDVVHTHSQAALVEAHALEAYRTDKERFAAKLRVLQQSELLPFSVIAYCPGGLDEKTLQRVKENLLQAEQTPRGRDLLNMCRINGFAPVPADFEQSLTTTLKAYPAPVKKDGK